ncbi:AbrB/MazE/SpoVT family DNA-binding domain-containing protein [Lacticaseibacillus parakribbianus]|uniref:AbrB/MazE/SpoVT family DNA-binding domain-containing protein n=1 Tax=Lacticaseibacillus parakribbianus TaxID=2970927 RepID=UPI0021CB3716|nr:AbrB/MazE/SpoVT family DNA-binding domain-containing protein [Lacticaseibacillus parakribbianus]
MSKNTSTMSSRGQIVIPAELRHMLGLTEGTRFIFYADDDGRIIMDRVPTISDWEKLTADLPTEDVKIDASGHYDATQSPHFDHWMKEG